MLGLTERRMAEVHRRDQPTPQAPVDPTRKGGPRLTTSLPERWSDGKFVEKRGGNGAQTNRPLQAKNALFKLLSLPPIATRRLRAKMVRRGRRFESVRGLCKSAARRRFLVRLDLPPTRTCCGYGAIHGSFKHGRLRDGRRLSAGLLRSGQ
jgi:hypothetical protein